MVKERSYRKWIWRTILLFISRSKGSWRLPPKIVYGLRFKILKCLWFKVYMFKVQGLLFRILVFKV